MAKFTLNADLLDGILERVPEAFIPTTLLLRRYRHIDRKAIEQLRAKRSVRDGDYWYLPERIDLEKCRRIRSWARPELPEIRESGIVVGMTISQRQKQREECFSILTTEQLAVIESLEQSDGYLPTDTLTLPTAALQKLEELGCAKIWQDTLYDPLKIGELSVKELTRRRKLTVLADKVTAYLDSKVAYTAPQQEIIAIVGEDTLKELIGLGVLSRFSVPSHQPPYSTIWVRKKQSDFKQAQAAAIDATRIPDEAWSALVTIIGGSQGHGRDGETARSLVLNNTYTISSAAKRLELRPETVEQCIQHSLLPFFVDPEGTRRIPSAALASTLENGSEYEKLAAFETIKLRDISRALSINYMSVRRRIKRLGFHGVEVRWADIRGKWKLPNTYVEFRRILAERRKAQLAEQALQAELERQQAEQDRARRLELRGRLVAAFPSWRHDGRAEQRMVLHVGPPNSGKTHEAISALLRAEQGWYLAPLRLLAFEIFDRVNRMGVRCNLLTGEEFIPVEGATVTAATIEMFNPSKSGDLVVIDEAQMLADPDRGWAWTRAFMEAEAPVIHVIAPPTAYSLVERMASAAGLPIDLVKHERLTPIKVADAPWRLRSLPERTILVAFSRQAVLELKTQLEMWKRRVSVVYGSLPPEVRRKQADRFAEGASEICIATDAVGMGLNLPADNVCFYDVRKFDGRDMRLLYPSEVQQIGGRAGRYGLSRAGEVGATNREDLSHVQRLFYAPATALTHARVAPTVADLEIIPGTLAERLNEWAILKSIPDTLRGAIETADLTERIELAKMLSEQDEAALGLAASLQLVSAPTRQSSRQYWYKCSRAIIRGEPLPLPSTLPLDAAKADDLERLETSISYADIYLWLGHRREFDGCAPDIQEVRILRASWSEAIDNALAHRIGIKHDDLD